MRIKEISELTGLTSHTLRYYEKVGLLRHINRNESGIRDYSEEDLRWINFLIKMKQTGMPLEDLVHYADSYYNQNPNVDVRIQLLERHKERVLEEISRLDKSLEFIDYKISFYNNYKLKNNKTG